MNHKIFKYQKFMTYIHIYVFCKSYIMYNSWFIILQFLTQIPHNSSFLHNFIKTHY